jgi:hypothetical protein
MFTTDRLLPTPDRVPTILRRVSALCGVALLGVACSGGGADDSTDTAAESDPLLAGLLDGKTFEEAEFEIQQKVQACMTALGWEYTAVAPGSTAGGGGVTATDFDQDAFAAESGYGVSTFGADVTGTTPSGTGGAESDPNIVYSNSLSPSDQEAYFNDLYGPPITDSDLTASTDVAGCFGDATNAVYGEDTLAQMDDQFAEIDARMQADSRILAASEAWAGCMSERGYSYASPTEPFDDILARFQALGAEPDPATLSAFREEEIATALADRACAKEAGLDEIQQQVYDEIASEIADAS